MKTRSKWLIFTLVAIAQFMVVLDSAITNVALPTIKQQLGFSASGLQWVITAYGLCFGGFLLLGGRVADLYGRRRTLLSGMAAFTTFSLLIGLSHTSTELIALRALQGAAAAFMSPAALSIVLVTFRDGPDRNKALGFWALVATAGAAIGLLLGGFLTQYLGWRWNFFINVPVGVVMLGLISRLVPVQEKESKKLGLDARGALLVTSSLMLQVFAFSQAPQWGWLSGKFLGVAAAALVLLAGFVFNESRVKNPLMPLSILKIRNVTGANMVMAPIYATMLGTFFLVTLYIQGILGFSPLKTGFSFLPMPIVLGLISTRIPKLVARYGFKRFLIIGPLTVAAALLFISRVPVHGNYFTDVLPGLVIMAAGVGMIFMPTIAAATSGVPAKESGLASGLISTSQQMGGALGLSIISGIAASATANLSKADVVHGYHVAFLADVAFVLFAAIVSAVLIRQGKPSKQSPQPKLIASYET